MATGRPAHHHGQQKGNAILNTFIGSIVIFVATRYLNRYPDALEIPAEMMRHDVIGYIR
jgi:hypothetical protein